MRGSTITLGLGDYSKEATVSRTTRSRVYPQVSWWDPRIAISRNA